MPGAETFLRFRDSDVPNMKSSRVKIRKNGSGAVGDVAILATYNTEHINSKVSIVSTPLLALRDQVSQH